MKPPPFAYADPATLDEALALLAAAGEDAAVIAGGQSLVPLLNLRLARPELVIDLCRLDELRTIELDRSGLRVGAMARVADVEEHGSLGEMPGLASVLANIGHRQIRARTTFGGSIAHADPAAELPALLTALDGEVELQSAERGRRSVAAQELLVGPLMTSRESDELVTGVRFPAVGPIGIAELAKRPGDFAIAGAVATYSVDDDTITDPRVAVFGVGPTPVRAVEAERTLAGRPPGPEAFAAAASVARDGIDPGGDVHGSADYRRHVAATMVDRALTAVA